MVLRDETAVFNDMRSITSLIQTELGKPTIDRIKLVEMAEELMKIIQSKLVVKNAPIKRTNTGGNSPGNIPTEETGPPQDQGMDEDWFGTSTEATNNDLMAEIMTIKSMISTGARTFATAVKSGDRRGSISAGHSHPHEHFNQENNAGILVKVQDKKSQRDGKTIRTMLSKIPLFKKGEVSISTRIKDKELLITCKNQMEATRVIDTLAQEDLSCGTYERRPLLKLFGLALEVRKEEIPELLFKQNQGTFPKMDCIKVVADKLNKDKSTRTIVLEVSREVAKEFIKPGKKLFIGPQRVSVIIDPQLVQCYHCRKFGHTTKVCKDLADWNTKNPRDKGLNMCVNCGDRHQIGHQCEITPRCTNCAKENEWRTKRNKDAKLLAVNHRSSDFERCEIAKKRKKEIWDQIFPK